MQTQVGFIDNRLKGTNSMTTTGKSLRVLIVDDNRDGADALGLLVEELGSLVHVTYGGRQALEVATAFRPDLMLVDLLMPGIDGYDLVRQLRQIPVFASTKIVAVTGLKDEGQRMIAITSGCDSVIVKPATLNKIKSVLKNIVPAENWSGQSSIPIRPRSSLMDERRMPIEEARRIRNNRLSKTLTQAESEAVICDGIVRFQEEYLRWRSEQIQANFINELLLVRIRDVLTLAERPTGKSLSAEKGRDLIKQTRKQLLELARPMLESLVHEATGKKVLSMHHDISTVTGEEMVVFSLAESPRFLQ